MATVEIGLNKFISDVTDDRLLTKVTTYSANKVGDMDIIEEAFVAFNGEGSRKSLKEIVDQYYAEGNHSLSVGDVVSVDGRAYLCQSMGWTRTPHPFTGQ